MKSNINPTKKIYMRQNKILPRMGGTLYDMFGFAPKNKDRADVESEIMSCSMYSENSWGSAMYPPSDWEEQKAAKTAEGKHKEQRGGGEHKQGIKNAEGEHKEFQVIKKAEIKNLKAGGRQKQLQAEEVTVNSFKKQAMNTEQIMDKLIDELGFPEEDVVLGLEVTGGDYSSTWKILEAARKGDGSIKGNLFGEINAAEMAAANTTPEERARMEAATRKLSQRAAKVSKRLSTNGQGSAGSSAMQRVIAQVADPIVAAKLVGRGKR
jgi:hypothetical protein